MDSKRGGRLVTFRSGRPTLECLHTSTLSRFRVVYRRRLIDGFPRSKYASQGLLSYPRTPMLHRSLPPSNPGYSSVSGVQVPSSLPNSTVVRVRQRSRGLLCYRFLYLLTDIPSLFGVETVSASGDNFVLGLGD